MKQKEFLFILSVTIFTGCYQRKVSQQNIESRTEPEQVVNSDTFQADILPEIPSILTPPDQHANFMVEHYWDKSDFADTCYFTHENITEQTWIDHVNHLNYNAHETTQKVIKKVLTRTSFNKDVFSYFTELSDKHLYDPNFLIRPVLLKDVPFQSIENRFAKRNANNASDIR
ncbi:DUF5106 domain-containing protein [Parabacteroides sp. W1-Q-101]|uniref:DUF5106 domain-containing protein n=1 Tax=Parabacteroides TaxID=375288 RepID=UPI00202F10C7|nr:MULTISPECIES: DUF5106 domain-containing protein [Parabacteroides]MCM0718306.1 DUF5106 domain-containing protein [Parabacteroides sp. W1-Q-101]